MQDNLKILFIDDEPEGLEDILRAEMEERFQGATLDTINSFQEAKATLLQSKPDVIILDLLQSGGSGDVIPVGLDIFKEIWDSRFCPIVVYSAHPEAANEQIPSNHPFIKFVKKGKNSEKIVFDNVTLFEPHIVSISKVETEIDLVVHQSLRNVAPLVFNYTEEKDRENRLIRAARRHVAASMDEVSMEGTNYLLASWEHYICPPVSVNIMVGDIISRHQADPDDPTNFFVILSPSCDMATSSERAPNVQQAMVAKCGKAAEFSCTLGMDSETGDKRKRKKLVSELTKGYSGQSIPLPALPGTMPTMTANLKDLALIDLANIGDNEEYCRVASVDSPFREMISWAYLQTAGRPGLPDRDVESWANEIITAEQNQ